MSSSHETLMVPLAFLLFLSFPIAIGFAIAHFTKIRLLHLSVGFTALGLIMGAMAGTTYTHAFDIIWWWKGLFLGVLFCLGASGSRLLRSFLNKR